MTAQTSTPTPRERYSAVSMALHWLIAAAIVVQIAMGWWMGTLGRTPIHRTVEGVHISLGLTVLLLTVLRLAWGLTHHHPRLPQSMPALDRRLAGIVHPLFYVLLFALPLTGWVMESVGKRPIPFWGLAWPHFPALAQLTGGGDLRALKEGFEKIHGTPLVWAMIALLVLHVAGAIKHQFDGHPILWRMAGWMKRPQA